MPTATWIDPTADRLAERAREGDAAALADLLARYHRFLWRVVRFCQAFYPRSDLDRDDLYQEAALAFIQLVREYDPTRDGGFGIYLRKLFGRTSRACYRPQLYRERCRTLGDAADWLPAPVPEPPAGPLDVTPELSAALQQARTHLLPREQALITTLYDDERRMGDVAQEWGLPWQTLKGVKSYAVAKLRTHLRDACPDRLSAPDRRLWTFPTQQPTQPVPAEPIKPKRPAHYRGGYGRSDPRWWTSQVSA